jgi:hypothetical protein
MAAKTYSVLNGAQAGAAAATPLSTGTAIKTMLQLQMGAQVAGRVVEWWTEFDGSAAATPIKVELLGSTGGPQTTLTTYAAGDITKANDPNAGTTGITLASNASGFGTGATEVTPTGVRNFATHLVPPTSGIYIQFPLGREPEQSGGNYIRHRTTAGASVNCYAGVTWEE